ERVAPLNDPRTAAMERVAPFCWRAASRYERRPPKCPRGRRIWSRERKSTEPWHKTVRRDLDGVRARQRAMTPDASRAHPGDWLSGTSARGALRVWRDTNMAKSNKNGFVSITPKAASESIEYVDKARELVGDVDLMTTQERRAQPKLRHGAQQVIPMLV